MKRLLLSAAVAAAMLGSVPADAAEVRPCDAGYVGVVVRDANGTLATLCVRDPGIDPGQTVDPWREWLGDVVTWVENETPPRCWYYPDTGDIRCEAIDRPPRPPL